MKTTSRKSRKSAKKNSRSRSSVARPSVVASAGPVSIAENHVGCVPRDEDAAQSAAGTGTDFGPVTLPLERRGPWPSSERNVNAAERKR